VFLHLLFLHRRGSRNAIYSTSDFDRVSFGPYFLVKDVFGVVFFFVFFFLVSFFFSYDLGDPENFNPANSLSTPVHIQPEWYFLFAYAILRSIPRKLGGVLALLMSILVFSLHSFFAGEFSQSRGFFLRKLNFWLFVGLFLLLT